MLKQVEIKIKQDMEIKIQKVLSDSTKTCGSVRLSNGIDIWFGKNQIIKTESRAIDLANRIVKGLNASKNGTV